MEHQFAPILAEIYPTVPFINGDPMYPMENWILDPNAMATYSHYSQTMIQPKIYNTWTSCPQYWTQVVFVQVNPGEVLTIKADDGFVQHIQGPADVPLIAPTGNLPPIYLPPGYISQVVEENGIQKIIVVPQILDYNMPLSAPVHQLSPFIAPPQFTYPQALPFMYPPVQGEFPMPYIQEFVTQQMPLPAPLLPPPMLPPPMLPPPMLQPPMLPPPVLPPPMLPPPVLPPPMLPPPVLPPPVLPPPVLPPPVLPPPVLPPPVLPPPMLPPPMLPSPAAFMYQEHHEYNTEYRTQPCCFNIEKPVVSDIQTRSATVSWNPNRTENSDHINSPVTFELALSSSGKNGIYKNIYNGKEVTVVLHDLQPCTVYFLRVTTVRGEEYRSVSEVVSFTTPGCEPDPPLAPKLINRTKNSLNLQWKGSKDNGSKISSFLLEWDEKTGIENKKEENKGKGEEFKSCYSGSMKQHKIFKLTASTKYSFRLAAKNNFGFSNFSEIAVFYTSGNTPPAPLPPKLKEAGVYSLSLEWCAPTNPNPNDTLTYVLEMEEPRSRLGFKPKYNGEDLSCTVRNLRRNTAYKFRIFAYNLEGRSNSSGEVKYSTRPAKPGYPKKPYVVGAIYARQVKIGWDSPKDNGGMHISSYSLEVSENSDGANVWKIIYNGTLKEFLYDDLQPGTTYKLRVFCTSPVGQSQPSDVLTIQTPTLPPESCRSLPLNGKTKCKNTNLLLGNRSVNGNLETVVRGRKAKSPRNDRKWSPGSEKKCAIPKCNGAEITDYRLQWGQIEDSMHLIYTGPCLRYEVKGLIPATTYFCRVQAVNIVGVGMFGGTGKVTTPGTVPAIVPMLQEVEDKVPAKLSSSCIAIQWEEPDCHGSPITGYNIEYGDKKILTVDRVTECVLKNLQPNTTYRIRIQAINHYGLSPFSPPIRSKTKPLPPEPPLLDCVVCGHQSLRFKWGNASNKKSLANFISYNLLMEDRSGRFSVIYHGPDLTHKVQKLSEYTQYKFKIQACNEAGEGPQSDVYTFTTTKTPPAALKAPKLHPLNNNSCEIKWDSLNPVKGDPIIYCLQIINGKKAEQIYKGPNTTFCFSNYLANSRYRFKVCAGRQYENSDGVQELWGPYSPSTLFSTYKHQSGHGKGGGGKGKGNHNDKDEKYKTEMRDDTFVLILMIGFALIAILCAVAIQYFLIN